MPLPMLTSSKASRISLKLTGMAQLLLHDPFRPDRDPLVEVHDLLVDQPEAARRHRMPDGLRRVGAVDAIDRVAEIERARAHWIAGAAGHEARQIGLPLDHPRRRRPIRPFRLARDLEQAVPLKSV